MRRFARFGLPWADASVVAKAERGTLESSDEAVQLHCVVGMRDMSG